MKAFVRIVRGSDAIYCTHLVIVGGKWD